MFGGKPWSALEDERLLKYHGTKTISALRAHLPGRTPGAIRDRIRRLRAVDALGPADPKYIAPRKAESSISALDAQAAVDSIVHYLSYEVAQKRMSFQSAVDIGNTARWFIAKHGPSQLLRGSVASNVERLIPLVERWRADAQAGRVPEYKPVSKPVKPKKAPNNGIHLSESQRKLIYQLIDDGLTNNEILGIVVISRSSLCRIRRRYR